MEKQSLLCRDTKSILNNGLERGTKIVECGYLSCNKGTGTHILIDLCTIHVIHAIIAHY